MHSTHKSTTIATSLEYCYLEHLDLQVPVQRTIRTPQRKAKYSDKERIRLKDAKKSALIATGCFSSREVKYWLLLLGIKLDLRLTAAWVAISKELASDIRLIKLGYTSVPPKANCLAQATYDINSCDELTSLNLAQKKLTQPNKSQMSPAKKLQHTQ